LKADSVNLSKSKSGGNLEAPIRECGGVNAVHREHAQVIFEMVMADKVQRCSRTRGDKGPRRARWVVHAGPCGARSGR